MHPSAVQPNPWRAIERALAKAIEAYKSDRIELADRLLQDVLSRRPDDIDARILRAVIAERQEKYATAVDQIRTALRIPPRNPRQPNRFGFSFAHLGAALERNILRVRDGMGTREAELTPQDYSLLMGVANHVMGKLAETRRYYRHAIEPPLASHHGRAMLSIANQQVGDMAAFRAEFDFEGDIRSCDSFAEVAVKDVAEFHRSLAACVRAHPSYRAEVHPESPYCKHVTDDLNVEPAEPIRVFAGILGGHVDRLIRSLPKQPGHPFRGAIPEAYRLYIFGAVVEPGGFHSPHVHTQGWLSGVYYVQLPEFDAAESGARAGCLEFGRPQYDHVFGFEPEMRTIRPRLGQLIAWPSYFFHSTVPCPAGGERVTIGFDVVPLR
jgi:Tfp pilus assembly protein PilF